jgi:Asp-tRNA(Asn)/Glu-tRNA(Gln) amidotransferase A subunit family amidase
LKGQFLDQVTRAPRRLSIALIADNWTGEGLHPECRTAVEQAGRLCEQLGHNVVPADKEIREKIPFASLNSAFGIVWHVSAQVAIDDRLAQLGRKLRDDEVEPVTLEAYERAKAITALQLVHARTAIHRSSVQMAQFLSKYDVILTPTLGLPPILLGEWTLERPYKDVLKYCPFTAIANMTGQPAMSIPLHWTTNGLPVGVQFMGRYGDESTLFRLAGQLEQESPWKDKRPSL